MFSKRIPLFPVFGFPLYLDWSWFFIAALITWSLATGHFPQQLEGYSQAAYWGMGLVAALLFFASIVAHELGHALMARSFDVEMRGITLFLFGGVAEMTEEPPSPRAEGWVAIAGPIVSAVIGIGSLSLSWLPVPEVVSEVLFIIGFVNLILAGFNMVPAFPLDGGRLLRALVWKVKGSLVEATKITSTIGGLFGLVLIGFGILGALRGEMVGGIWWVVIGLFLRGAAKGSYRQVLLRRSFEGHSVREMVSGALAVPRATPVSEFIEQWIYQHHADVYPVTDDGTLIGVVTKQAIKELDRDEWERQSVGALAEPAPEAMVVGPEEDAMQALERMQREQQPQLLVVDGDQLVGTLRIGDLIERFRDQRELEPAESG